MLKKIRHKLHISLTWKIVLVFSVFILCCSVIWTVVMFINMSNTAKENVLNDEISYMKSVESNIENVEEVCILATQTVEQMHSVTEYIDLVQNGGDYSTVEKIEFYDNEINSINNMTNINPYLYQIRLFANADITEQKPCFYKISRMDNMSWADNYEDGKWQIDYVDSVFPESTPDTRLAGIINKIEDDYGNLIAVLEVSTSMDSLFPAFSNTDNDEYSCFVDASNTPHYSQLQQDTWEENWDELISYFKEDMDADSVFVKFDGKRSIISFLPISYLNGTYIHIINVKPIINSYYSSQIPYIFTVLLSIVLFIFIAFLIARNIFRRFNQLTEDVSCIKSGESVKVSEQGDDEIGELGRQINNMLEQLDELNRENTNKQLLVKNAEIKSLQNQINAHFMYNVLETIKMMAELKEDYDISDAITSLGQMFRYSMQWTSGMVELKEEINYVRNYLNLLNLRFDYEIYLSLNIPDEFMDLSIPKMSLQPLVENSVYHGIENIAEDTTIYIKVFKLDDNIHLEVSDAGLGMDEEEVESLNRKLNQTESVDDSVEHGRALYNVQQRVKMYFGPQYGMTVYSKKGMYTKVVICMPAGNNETKNKEIKK